MEFTEAKDKFIQTWGTLATQWGINRSMAQLHALLLISPEPMTTEDVMEQLQISRGNASMNLRDLMDWGLIYKQLKAGERKEFYVAEKDIWKVARQVAKERRRREITPVVEVLNDLKAIDATTPEAQEFKRVMEGLSSVVGFADNTLNAVIRAEENWLMSQFLKVFR
ncbi:transcriptional regulator protein-like protein [Fibrisoma limi BUZ 3]|uniref:HTH-type transcriptional regulator n=1 Tax=Fibrisoma limi BUZ 3 TaxID=1185876 RepID=I2GN46_9BACT|nr:MarR family transcriptional regulator [Fibrisoma limi]CCH55324.1 transcriptional regulator protein-like protein [Fibrisoma limi BUZ 3]